MSTIAPPEVVRKLLNPTQAVNNLAYTCYNEQFFSISPTFNKWVPLMVVDILNLDTYASVYHKPPKSTRANKSKGPYMFMNHPINYVSIVGICIDATEKFANNDKVIVQVLTIDDGSSATITAVQYFDSDDQIYDVQNKVVHIQGPITEFHDQRQIRINNLYIVEDVVDEFTIFRDILKVRTKVLSQPWVVDPLIITKAKNKLLLQKKTSSGDGGYDKSLLESLRYIHEASGTQEDFEDTGGVQDSEEEDEIEIKTKNISESEVSESNKVPLITQMGDDHATDAIPAATPLEDPAVKTAATKPLKQLTPVKRLLSRISSQKPQESCSFLKKQPNLVAPLRKSIERYTGTLDDDDDDDGNDDKDATQSGNSGEKIILTREELRKKPIYSRVRSDYDNYGLAEEIDPLKTDETLETGEKKVTIEEIKETPETEQMAKLPLTSSSRVIIKESDNLLKLIEAKQISKSGGDPIIPQSNIQVPSSLVSRDTTPPKVNTYPIQIVSSNEPSQTGNIKDPISISQSSDDIIIKSSPKEIAISTQGNTEMVSSSQSPHNGSQKFIYAATTTTPVNVKVDERRPIVVTLKNPETHKAQQQPPQQQQRRRQPSSSIKINGFVIQDNDINQSWSDISRLSASQENSSPLRWSQGISTKPTVVCISATKTTSTDVPLPDGSRLSIVYNQTSQNWNNITAIGKERSPVIAKPRVFHNLSSLLAKGGAANPNFNQSRRELSPAKPRRGLSPVKFSKYTVDQAGKSVVKPVITPVKLKFTTTGRVEATTTKRGTIVARDGGPDFISLDKGKEGEKVTLLLSSSQPTLKLEALNATSTPVGRNTDYFAPSTIVSPTKGHVVKSGRTKPAASTLFDITTMNSQLHDSATDILVPATYKRNEMKRPQLPTWHSSNSSSSSGPSQASQFSQASQLSQETGLGEDKKDINSQQSREVSKISNTSGEISRQPFPSSAPEGQWCHTPSFLNDLDREIDNNNNSNNSNNETDKSRVVLTTSKKETARGIEEAADDQFKDVIDIDTASDSEDESFYEISEVTGDDDHGHLRNENDSPDNNNIKYEDIAFSQMPFSSGQPIAVATNVLEDHFPVSRPTVPNTSSVQSEVEEKTPTVVGESQVTEREFTARSPRHATKWRLEKEGESSDTLDKNVENPPFVLEGTPNNEEQEEEVIESDLESPTPLTPTGKGKSKQTETTVHLGAQMELPVKKRDNSQLSERQEPHKRARLERKYSTTFAATTITPTTTMSNRRDTVQYQAEINNNALANQWGQQPVPIQSTTTPPPSSRPLPINNIPNGPPGRERRDTAFKSTFGKFQRFLWELCVATFNGPNAAVSDAYGFTVNHLIKLPRVRAEFDLVCKYWVSPTKDHERGLKLAVNSALEALVRQGLVLRVGDTVYQTINRFNLGFKLEYEQKLVLAGKQDAVNVRNIIEMLKFKGQGWRSYPNTALVVALVDKWLNKQNWVKVSNEGIWKLNSRYLDGGH